MSNSERNRNLTDADAEAIADALKERMITHFYRDLGKGVWAMVWRVIVIAMISIAAYGAIKSMHS